MVSNCGGALLEVVRWLILFPSLSRLASACRAVFGYADDNAYEGVYLCVCGVCVCVCVCVCVLQLDAVVGCDTMVLNATYTPLPPLSS